MTPVLPPETAAIVSFVRNALGCGCPDEVFSKISIETPPDALARLSVTHLIKIGGRLMVAFWAASSHMDGFGRLRQIFSSGKKLRDRYGFNRFRLVAITDNPQRDAPRLHYRLTRCTALDDRMHLHVMKPSALPECLKQVF